MTKYEKARVLGTRALQLRFVAGRGRGFFPGLHGASVSSFLIARRFLLLREGDFSGIFSLLSQLLAVISAAAHTVLGGALF
jgi:hypothetical protein